MPETAGLATTSADRTYQGLARQILELIQSGELAAGSRLPSERALADRFGVSRTVVREAIIALEVQGLVDVRLGSGIYVAASAPGRSAVLDLPPGPGPIEALRARALIESEIAALAARERKDSDLDRIFAAVAAMREKMDEKRASDDADRDFHRAIAQATGNTLLINVVAAIWDAGRSDPLWKKIEQHFHTRALRQATLDDHQRIFEAIMARDSDAARAAMTAHLDRVIREFTRAWR
jgi:GntR family transcriptional regulator, uxu operon transcriptional repressor